MVEALIDFEEDEDLGGGYGSIVSIYTPAQHRI